MPITFGTQPSNVSNFTIPNLASGYVKANTPSPWNAVAAPKPAPNSAAPNTNVATTNANTDTTNNTTPTNTNANATTAGTNKVDLQAAAYYNDLGSNIQNQIDALGGTQNQLIDNVNHSADAALKDTNDSYAIANRNYNLARTGTVNDNELAKAQIDDGVVSNTNSMQRLLGIAGSGNSSAANYAAFAAAKLGTDQRTGVQRSYDKNLQSQDTNYGDTTDAYNKNIGKIGEGRTVKSNAVRQSVNNNRISLLNTLAGLKIQAGQAGGQDYTTARAAAGPYEQQIRDATAANTGLMKDYANPIYDTTGVAFKPPTLESYNQPMAGAVKGATNTNEQISPAYYNLLKKDPNGNILA